MLVAVELRIRVVAIGSEPPLVAFHSVFSALWISVMTLAPFNAVRDAEGAEVVYQVCIPVIPRGLSPQVPMSCVS